MNKIKYLKFLEDNKGLVGLHGWKIRLNDTIQKDNDAQARTHLDIYEKYLYVDLHNQFVELTEKERKKVLLHELVHARMRIHEIECHEDNRRKEEILANDLTNGLERANGL